MVREGGMEEEGCSPLDKGRQCFLWLVRGWHRCFLPGGGALRSEKNARALTAGRYCCRSLGKIRARRSVGGVAFFFFSFAVICFVGGHVGFAVSVLIRGALRSGLVQGGWILLWPLLLDSNKRCGCRHSASLHR